MYVCMYGCRLGASGTSSLGYIFVKFSAAGSIFLRKIIKCTNKQSWDHLEHVFLSKQSKIGVNFRRKFDRVDSMGWSYLFRTSMKQLY